MGQLPYYRNVWALGPSNNGYPGAFPRGFVRMVRRKWWGQKRLWMFSGSFKDKGGVTVDIKPEVNPTHIANCEKLPFKDNTFDFVMADPPYSKEEAKQLYGTRYPTIATVLNEMARVTKIGGHALFLHRLIPVCHPQLSSDFKRLKVVGIVGVFTIAGFTNMRALTIWRKSENLTPFLNLDSSEITEG
jgi:SAM-dependent methyltransferase